MIKKTNYKLFIIFLLFISCSHSIKQLTKPTLSELQTPGRVLLVVAHQDDEVFIASRLKSHIDLGDTLMIVWTAISTQKNLEYANRRIDESLLGAKTFLDLSDSSLIFLKYEDGKTFENIDEIYVKIKSVIEKFHPNIIYVPAYELGHVDHDVAHISTVLAHNKLNYNSKIYEFPMYSAYHLSRIFPFKMRNSPPDYHTRYRILLDSEKKFVLDYWNVFDSQHFPLDWYIRFISSRNKTFGVEYIRKVPDYDYSKKPPEYDNIAYERFLNNVKYQDFSIQVEKLLSIIGN